MTSAFEIVSFTKAAARSLSAFHSMMTDRQRAMAADA